MLQKKLYKSQNCKVAGVCGGIAEFLGVDPAIIRIIWALVAMSTGVGLIAYIIAAVVMDDAPVDDTNGDYVDVDYQESVYTEEASYVEDDGEIKGFKP